MNTTIFIFGVMYFQTMIHGNRYQPESPRASNLPSDQVKNSSISWPSSSTVGNVECPVEMFNFFLLHSKAFIDVHFMSHLFTTKLRWCPLVSRKCLGSFHLMKNGFITCNGCWFGPTTNSETHSGKYQFPIVVTYSC